MGAGPLTWCDNQGTEKGPRMLPVKGFPFTVAHTRGLQSMAAIQGTMFWQRRRAKGPSAVQLSRSELGSYAGRLVHLFIGHLWWDA